MRSSSPPIASQTCRCAEETQRPSTSRTRIADGTSQLRKGATQAFESLPNLENQEVEDSKVRVEVLYVADCPSHPAAVELVKYVLASNAVKADVTEILVADERMARELQFRGSPTIRINGRDIAEDSGKTEGCGLTCRLYPGSLQIGLPPVDLVHRAVTQAKELR